MVDVAREMERRAARAAAADRRRDDLAPAHRGEDRARVLERDGARARREPRRRRRLGAARPEAPARRSTSRTASCRSGCASSTPRSCAAAAAARAGAREPRRGSRFDDLPDAAVHRHARRSSRALAELVPYIDWQFFFHAWELKGKFPAILEQPGGARALRRRAGAARRDRAATARCRARGVYGFWPAHAEGDDVVVDGTRFCFLRQQADHGDGRPNRCLADYVAPADDHVGAFAVAIHGADELAAPLRGRSTTTTRRSSSRRSPTGSPRRSPSGCTSARGASGTRPTSTSPSEDLLAERFRGIRPAFGYPACPDHSEKAKLFDLLGAASVGHRADRELRDDCPPRPSAASTSHHPQSRYFAVGRIGRDQLEDYAARKGEPVAEAERWLGPSLSELSRLRRLGYPDRAGALGAPQRFHADDTEERRRARRQRERQRPCCLPARARSARSPATASRRRPARTGLGLLRRILVGTLLAVAVARLAVAGGALPLVPPVRRERSERTHPTVVKRRRRRSTSRSPNHAGDRARDRLRPSRRRRGEPAVAARTR